MEAGAVFALRLSEKAKIAENILFPYGRTGCLSNRIVILDRQKGANAKKGEDTMKKIGMFLLGMAAALNVLLVICMVGERMGGVYVHRSCAGYALPPKSRLEILKKS